MNETEHSGAENDAHPDMSTLLLWAEGDLPDDASRHLEQHVERCDECANRVGDLTANDPFLERIRAASGLLPAALASESSAEKDSNLLFGALALQAGFITPQQLAEACVLWSTRGGTSLGQILVDQGWMDGATRESVASLLGARATLINDRRLPETLPGTETITGAAGQSHSDTTRPGFKERIRLKKLHSQGGIGQLWLAQDELLGREVALKELLPELRGSPSHRERFFREARVAAQLSHPGTAPVYEYREEDGRCYYTMRFYSGKTLSQAIRQAHSREKDDSSPTSFERLFPLIEYFLSVCDTIAYAHSQGIVHRDLKGENVVLGEFGEVTVVDWGLAKSIAGKQGAISPLRESDSHGPTIEGERLGTPGYMAPEQARGDLAAIDERTDVYGLAAVLYEVLTGRPPFSGETANEVMHLVETQPPVAPSVSHVGTPEELETICLRNLAKRKEDRLSSAGELRDAVRTWLARRLKEREDSDRQSKFFSLSQDLFIALDENGAFTQVNPAYERFFGISSNDKRGTHYLARVHPDDVAPARQMFENVLRGVSSPDTVVRVQCATGEYLPVSWSVTRIPGQSPVYAVGRPMDEQSEQRRLADERSRFFALSHDLFATYDESFHITQANKACSDLLKYTEEELVGRPGLFPVHPEDLERVQRDVDAVQRGGASIHDIVVRLVGRDGAVHRTNWTLTRVSGQQTTYALGRVLDERSEARRATAARARFFALSPDLFVISDDRGAAAQINPAWKTLLGWDPQDVVGNPFFDFVHPDDVGPITHAGRRALTRGPVIDLMARMRHKDGGYLKFSWTLCRIEGDRINYAVGRVMEPLGGAP